MKIRGRDTELARLTQAVDDTVDGRGGLVLLSGEAGIGKSRLAAETLAHARERGCTVLDGQAHPLHSGLAYAPIVEALRPHLTGEHNLGQLMGDPRLPAATPTGDPELERTRMFEAVARLISGLVPAVLFIDDLHWADRGTVELVHYIGRQQVLVLAAYRPSDALADLSISARRAGNEIQLAPLTDTAVAEVARDLLDTEPSEAMLRGVTARAKGIPLFVTALVHDRATALRPDTLPVIVRDVVLSRLHQLDEDERKLIEIVSVAESASVDLLQALWGGDGLDAPLRKLLTYRLVIEQGSTYRIAHPLYAEVAYAELTLGERRSLHAAIARTIDMLAPDDVLALAPHYREAGDLVDAARAAAITAEAGWRAMAVLDADEAVQYFTAAVQSSPADPLLLEGLGRAYQARGQLGEAAATWERATTVADGALRSSLHYRIALLAAERGKPTPDLEFAADDPDAAILKMIVTLRRTHATSTSTVVDELLAFAADPSPAGQAVASCGLALQAISEHDLTRARQAALESVNHARRCTDDSPIQINSARRLLIWISIATGNIPAAIEHATAVRQEVARFDVPSAVCSLQFGLVAAHYLHGDLHTALREAAEGERMARSGKMYRSLTRLLLVRSILLAEQGRLAEAAACRAEAENTWIPRDVSVSTLANLSDMIISIHSGHTGNVAVSPEWVSYNEPLSCLQPLFAGTIYLATKDEENFAETVRGLGRFGDTAPFFTAVADRLTGLHTSSPELLARAAASFDRMGARLLAAQTHLEWAELTGDRGVVVALFDENDAAPWSSRARKHARAVGVRIPQARTTGVLTNRELQVVRLLGDGLSNAGIAARLFLSERTVETHLRNSYAKLNLTSRVALARWAAENGGRE